LTLVDQQTENLALFLIKGCWHGQEFSLQIDWTEDISKVFSAGLAAILLISLSMTGERKEGYKHSTSWEGRRCSQQLTLDEIYWIEAVWRDDMSICGK